MLMVNEQQWQRHAARYVVEILVGAAWTEHATVDTLSEAEKALKKILVDRAVREARICEVASVTTSTIIAKAVQELDSRVPFHMKDTHKKAKCAVCGTSSVVADDGTFRWTVCKTCNTTLPVEVD